MCIFVVIMLNYVQIHIMSSSLFTFFFVSITFLSYLPNSGMSNFVVFTFNMALRFFTSNFPQISNYVQILDYICLVLNLRLFVKNNDVFPTHIYRQVYFFCFYVYFVFPFSSFSCLILSVLFTSIFFYVQFSSSIKLCSNICLRLSIVQFTSV